jgi:hypothetical protein
VKLIDLTGQTFGSWTVLRRADNRSSGQTAWLCRCACGAEHEQQGNALREGLSKQCRECQSKAHRTHGLSRSPEHATWIDIKQRCLNPNNSSWHNYGGRGVTLAPEWQDDFAAFYAELGPKPSPQHSIDRTDNERGYEPGNCRWSTRAEQALNTRQNVRWTYGGKTQTITEWSTELGIKVITLWQRVNAYGWSVERALSTPVRR